MPDELSSDSKPEITPVPADLYTDKPTVADQTETPFTAENPLAEVKRGEKGLAKASDKPLTDRALAFLELVVAGWDVYKAYKTVGYTGSYHAAIQMKSDLRFHLVKLLEMHGVSKEDLKIQVLQMLQLPLAQAVVNVDEKLKLVRAMDKLMDKDHLNSKPKITPFVLNIEKADGVTIQEGSKE